MNDDYKAALRDFMARKGIPIEINPDAKYEFDEVSVYGYVDYEARSHCAPASWVERYPDQYQSCTWVVPEGSLLKERTYSLFQDTYSDNKDEVGINVSGVHCKCREFENVTLRFVGSLHEVLHDILKIDNAKVGIEL